MESSFAVDRFSLMVILCHFRHSKNRPNTSHVKCVWLVNVCLSHGHTHKDTPGTWNSAIPTMGFGIAEVSARKCGHWLVTGQYSMIPGLVWYQPICSLDHAEDVSYYVTCFSATTFVDERC